MMRLPGTSVKRKNEENAEKSHIFLLRPPVFPEETAPSRRNVAKNSQKDEGFVPFVDE